MSAFEKAVSVVLVEREITGKLSPPIEETVQVAAARMRLIEIQVNSISSYMDEYPALKSMFEGVVGDRLKTETSLGQISRLFLTLRRMAIDQFSSQVFDFSKALLALISTGL